MEKICFLKKISSFSSCIYVVFIALVSIGCRESLDNSNQNSNNGGSIKDSIGLGATELAPAPYPDSVDLTAIGNSVSGYSNKLSYYPGDSIYLYLSGPAQHNATISLNDMNGAPVFSITADIRRQKITNRKPWVDGLGYQLTISTVLPSYIPSGIYYWNNVIPLIVKSKEPKEITVVFPSNTLNAYCTSGGKSLYYPLGKRAFVVSFYRFLSRSVNVFNNNFLKWLTNMNYNVNYICDEDMEDYGNISSSKLLIITGHSEYWTRKGRENFDAFVNAGNNALILAGNTMWWQVRYDKPKNLMICYKDKTYDPLGDTPLATINWYTPYLNYPTTQSLMTDFFYGGYGKSFSGRILNAFEGYKIVDDKSPLLAGTNLSNGDTLKFNQFECDGALLKTSNLLGSNALPVLNTSNANVYKIELLGYNITLSPPDNKTSDYGVGTFLVFKRSASSGTVVNTASETWCQDGFSGLDGKLVEIITKNMIDESLAGQNLFTY